jgi:two-component system sensor histidine kinase CpxA
MIKKITGFRLFWKIYLTLLLVLFLPIILFTLSRIMQDRDGRMPDGLSRHLEWSASSLADMSESVPDENLGSWAESVKKTIGLDVRVSRGGLNFHAPGSEWLESNAPADEPAPRPTPHAPLVVSSRSRSGRTEVTAALPPFNGPGGSRIFRNSAVFLSVAILSVIFSFMIVQNFMTPLSELRRITLKLASGDLSVRAGHGLTGRSDEIADLGKSFNWMAECVENIVGSQKRLLSDISHEIRSPLQRMEVALAILRKKSNTGEEAYIDRMELEIYHIDNMVEELLTLARSDTVNLSRAERLDLDEMINSIIEDIEFETGEKKKIISDTQKLSAMGDATLLNRALSNVIHNAFRYSPPGSEIEINARREEGRIAITVRDHGPGVPEDELDKIFTPYYRTDKARKRSNGGVGLGLAITKRIVENHGGEISAVNDPAGGLKIVMLLISA